MEFGWVGNLQTCLSPTMDSLRSWQDLAWECCIVLVAEP